MSEVSNDNEFSRAPEARIASADGQAAFLLIESLLHCLVERSLLSLEDAIAIVDVAMEVKLDGATELRSASVDLDQSLTLLKSIRDSLSIDLR